MSNQRRLFTAFLLVAIITFAVVFGGCSTTYNIQSMKEEYAINPTPALAKQIDEEQSELDRKEYNFQIDLQNWSLCETVYENAMQPTYHRDHSHQRHMTRSAQRHAVRDDLYVNQCKKILGSNYWSTHVSEEDWSE